MIADARGRRRAGPHAWLRRRRPMQAAEPRCCASASARGAASERLQRITPDKQAVQETDRATYQAMEALVHNLNTMHSRAGAQIPFSSINYGTDTSPEGRHGHQEHPAGHRGRPGQRARRPSSPSTSSRSRRGSTTTRASPTTTCSSWPAGARPSGCSPTSPSWTRPSTCSTISPAIPNTEIAYMGCRTRVMGNAYDPSREIDRRPGQPELHLHQPAPAGHQGQRQRGYLLRGAGPEDRPGHRPAAASASRSSARKQVRNYPFLMGQGVWLDSRQAGPGRRGAGGAQARHPDRGLHRPGRDASRP